MVEQALEADDAATRAEWLAEFRDDVQAFVSGDVVDASTVPGRLELPPISDLAYRAFADPSGGLQDAMTLAIAHAEGERVVLDAVREVKPPFSPDAVVGEFATLLKAYGCATVTSDRYGGEWPRERFAAHGIHYTPAEQSKSELYTPLLPLLNAARADLLDVPRLRAQLVGLERRTTRHGRVSVDHRPGSHDDVVNAVAGALIATAQVSDCMVLSNDLPFRPPVRMRAFPRGSLLG